MTISSSPTPTPSVTPDYDYYSANLQDCCTGVGYESKKFKLLQGTPINVGNVIFINIGSGDTCFELTTAPAPIAPSASPLSTVYNDCTDCRTNSGQGPCPSQTPTPTPTVTPTNTVTPSNPPTITPTRTSTPPVTPTKTVTPSVTSSPPVYEYYEVYAVNYGRADNS